MTHRYAAASDGWISFITPARQLFVGAELDDATVERLWALVTDATGAAGVLEVLAAEGLFATPPFVFVEASGDDINMLVRGDAVVTAGAEQVSGAGATTWIERRVPAGDLTLTVGGSGSRWFPLESGVVRASGFTIGDVVVTASVVPADASPARAAKPVTAPPVAQLAEPLREVTPPPAPSASVPVLAPVPTAAAPRVAPPPAAPAPAPAPVAAPSPAPATHDDEHVSEATFLVHDDEEAPAEAAAPVAPDTDADGYDYLFGETVVHSVQDAAVHAIAEGEPGADPGDPDGATIVMSNRRGRLRPPPEAAPAAPGVPEPVIVMPDGTRESLAQAIVVGRSPSVSGVPAGQLPRLITVTSSDQDISRSHVRIALEGGTVVVTDLHSRNGTLVVSANGQTIKLRAGEPTPVISGSKIDLGGVVLTVVEV